MKTKVEVKVKLGAKANFKKFQKSAKCKNFVLVNTTVCQEESESINAKFHKNSQKSEKLFMQRNKQEVPIRVNNSQSTQIHKQKLQKKLL